MRLEDWCEKYGILPTTPTAERGAVSVILPGEDTAPRPVERAAGLYNLEDYKVSSRSGPVVWLVPVRTPEAGGDATAVFIVLETDEEGHDHLCGVFTELEASKHEASAQREKCKNRYEYTVIPWFLDGARGDGTWILDDQGWRFYE